MMVLPRFFLKNSDFSALVSITLFSYKHRLLKRFVSYCKVEALRFPLEQDASCTYWECLSFENQCEKQNKFQYVERCIYYMMVLVNRMLVRSFAVEPHTRMWMGTCR